MNNENKVVKILWTGGWDSTYRIVELFREQVQIQPIYCCDPSRGSMRKEVETMENIRDALLKKAKLGGITENILPIKYIRLEEIPKDENITAAYDRLCKSVKLGSQYEWLARLTKIYPGLEIGIEKPSGEYSGCVDAIETFGKMKEDSGVRVIDSDRSSEDCNLLFGGFRFPIIDVTEVEMVNNIKQWGYEDIMKMIWFCHSPIKGRPCGICRPCQQKMECNMQFLLPRSSQRRYKLYRFMNKTFGLKAGRIAAKIIRVIS